MRKPITAPYGEWASPLTPEVLADSAVRLSAPALCNDRVYWIESRPQQGGRNVLVEWDPRRGCNDLLCAPFSARSRAHEYGGGAYLVQQDAIWFCNDEDQRVYCLDLSAARAGASPRPLTAPGPWRYADLVMDQPRQRLIAVREDHSEPSAPENSLVSISLQSGEVRVLASGHDFFASPRLRRDGLQLAYLSWNHPQMPWHGTTLWLAQLDAAGFKLSPREIAGGTSESIFQPQFSPNGDLWFVSDRSGWWNLYRYHNGHVQHMIEDRAEYAMPQWQFGMSTYGFTAPDWLCAASTREGSWTIHHHHWESGKRVVWPGDVCAMQALVANVEQSVAIVSSATQASAIVRWQHESSTVQTLRLSSQTELACESIACAQAVDFASDQYSTAHGFLYLPRNERYLGPVGSKPPLIVIGHGGPTGAASSGFSLAIQFWTTRGFAVLDVNYRGSTGFGREYSDSLKGGWGVVDVADCVNGALHLANSSLVDRHRLIIRGGSAGGFTALAALTFYDVFAAGASYYGIGELEALARDTHKFESRYLDWLVGPYPKQQALYRQRSPIHHVEDLSCPVIFFQGLEDKVVPPNQAQMMHDALDAKGIPVACTMFEGEQHGFRRAETIVRTLQAELAFYGRVLGFTPAGELPSIEIRNLP